jgi:hypothetical protein
MMVVAMMMTTGGKRRNRGTGNNSQPKNCEQRSAKLHGLSLEADASGRSSANGILDVA